MKSFEDMLICWAERAIESSAKNLTGDRFKEILAIYCKEWIKRINKKGVSAEWFVLTDSNDQRYEVCIRKLENVVAFKS